MSVVGFDVGNESGIVAVARQRGIDVVLNDESKRETPVIVSFGESQRFVGVAGAASQMMNPKNTISQIKRLIGRKFNDPGVQKDKALFPFSVTEGPDGDPLINVMFMNEKRSFTPTQILGMMLSNLKSIAEKNLESSVTDCVIGVPVYFMDAQRRAYLDAAAIAGLRPLRLMHETTATALAYGIYKTDLSETEPFNVAFVDVGHASLQVCIVAFKKGQLKVLAQAFDASLGGRDFDEALFDYFCNQFKENYKIDVKTNARASLRLRAACEKIKKMLSANPEAPLNIECLMDEKDVRSSMKRDLFEELAKPVIERVRGPCLKALEESGLTPEQISVVEVVGSGSRVPALLKVLTSVFGREPSRTMNASECIARGCALQCAMLSPTFRVRDFEVQDSYPFPIALSWKQVASATEGEGEDSAAQPNQVVFTANNPLPSSKLLTFYRTETFTIDAFYSDPERLPYEANPHIGTFTVGPFAPSKQLADNVKPKLKVKIRLNLHGLLSVESATLLEEEEVEVKTGAAPDAAAKEAAPMETEAPAAGAAAEGDAKMDDAEGEARAAAGNGAQEAAAPAKVEKKKKMKRTEIPIQSMIGGGLSAADLQQAVEKEYELALQDRVMEETKDKKNSVEAYVYDMRNKLYDKLQNYVTEAERDQLMALLQSTEDWLYEDGENETKSVYVAKLEELKKLGDPIESRLKEEEARGPAVESLGYCITSFRDAALQTDDKYDHIDPAEKAKVVDECTKAEAWLREKQAQQSVLPKMANAVLLSADIKKKAETLDRFCKPIMTRPKPKAQPPPQPSPPPPPPASESKPEAGATPDAEMGGSEVPPAGTAGGEPMQTE
eukprot:TRINITY_DN2471_c0_g1_i1.p1 TRINITY_DN2471_c0_g1~~TRINITY_DN2471_c0_g1_i1.p1  ORF type:complete len:840 (+),score=205.94 TRINITY_DN2471_c0_g1_i1:111-2630(+)